MSLLRAAILVEGLQALIGFGLAAFLLFSYVSHGVEAGGALLLVYWALNLPAIGQDIAIAARQYPTARNLTLRLYEPLGAREDGSTAEPARARVAEGGVALALEGVGVTAGGHRILDGLQLALGAGEHVAIVGPSGAGKSSLVGLLLGWHHPSEGRIVLDGRVLDGPELAALRRETAWIDPAVQLWNRPFVDNLRYGGPDSSPLDTILDAAELRKVLAELPDGMQTPLGEGGGLVSGGEGQRVRFGRALGRKDARLVILDEPFRGLDRERRRALYARARLWWPNATLLCITHDVGETRDFPRVLVIEGGRLVEDGEPGELYARGSRYRALVDAEDKVRVGLWRAATFRRVRVADGQVHDEEEVA
jgi:ATP-binding cassette subfamily B protein